MGNFTTSRSSWATVSSIPRLAAIVFFKPKTAYEMRISDWSSDVCSSDLQRLHGEGGLAAAKRFSEDVLSVFLPILLLFTAAFEIFMPAFVWLMASGYAKDAGKFALTVELTRITFPYLMLISLVSLLSGILNSMSKFAAAAAAPILLNIAMMTGILLVHDSQIASARALAASVTVAGILQFLWMLWAVKRAGLTLRLRLPRLTGEVRGLGRIILRATFGRGVYQRSEEHTSELQ